MRLFCFHTSSLLYTLSIHYEHIKFYDTNGNPHPNPIARDFSHDPSHTPRAEGGGQSNNNNNNNNSGGGASGGGASVGGASGAAPLSARGPGPLSSRSYTPSATTPPTFWAVDGDHASSNSYQGANLGQSQKNHTSNLFTDGHHTNYSNVTSITTPRTYHDVVPVVAPPPSSPPSSSARGQGPGTGTAQAESSGWMSGRSSGGFLSTLLHGHQEPGNAHLPMISNRLGLRQRGGATFDQPVTGTGTGTTALNLSVHSVSSHMVSLGGGAYKEPGTGHHEGGDHAPQDSSVSSPLSTLYQHINPLLTLH